MSLPEQPKGPPDGARRLRRVWIPLSEREGGRSAPALRRYAIRDRICAVAVNLTWREIAKKTGFNHETVRRYCLLGGASAEFVLAFCQAYGVSVHWLLTGDGALYDSDLKSDILQAASMQEIFRALERRARKIEEDLEAQRVRLLQLRPLPSPAPQAQRIPSGCQGSPPHRDLTGLPLEPSVEAPRSQEG